MTKISVITVSYNAAETIEKTIQSVVSQSAFSDIEYIIIDGVSNDGTQKIIEKYKDKISYFVSEKDGGIYNAMNKGISAATGDYIHFLNANDTYFDDKIIEKVIKNASGSNADFVIGDVALTFSDGHTEYRSNKNLSKISIFAQWIYHVSLFSKRELFEKYGNFDEKYKIAADNAWLLPLLKDENIKKSYLEIPIANFDCSGVSNNLQTQIQTVDELEEILLKNYKGKDDLTRKILSSKIFLRKFNLFEKFLNRFFKFFNWQKKLQNHLEKKAHWKINFMQNFSSKLVFVAHSYHKKTKSCDFMVDYLREFYDVEVIYDDSWQTNSPIDLSFVDTSFKAVIFWQVIPDKDIVSKINNKNLVYFPMYDYTTIWTLENWRACEGMKTICFSKKMYEKFKKAYYNAIYIQYFPKPKEFIEGDIKKVFFWQRITKINFDTIKKLFGANQISLHYHKALDPMHKLSELSEEDIKNYKITQSEWFEDKSEADKIVSSCGIYVAPRIAEGIGMSFLDAMAMGKVVVANDEATMNEYITNGVNGFLFNRKHPKKINLGSVAQMQKHAYEYVKCGYEKWLVQKRNIIDFIETQGVERNLSFFKKTFRFLLLLRKKDIIRLKLGKNGYFTFLGWHKKWGN